MHGKHSNGDLNVKVVVMDDGKKHALRAMKGMLKSALRAMESNDPHTGEAERRICELSRRKL